MASRRLARQGTASALLLLAAGLVAGCGGDETPETGGGGAGGGTAEAGAGGGNAVIDITIFHTSDEHGQLARRTDAGTVYGGAADMAAWLAADGYDPAYALLVSSGDNWMGAAISTVFQGEPMIEVMNAMGYAASALGNHEFDLGQEVLAERAAQAEFPYLGSNVKLEATGLTPGYALPSAIVTVASVDVGLIGLTTPATATATNPAYVADLVFEDLSATLDELVPELRAEGADIVVVLAHAGLFEVAPLVEQLAAPPDLILAGHSHNAMRALVAGVPILESGSQLMGYRAVPVRFDPVTEQLSLLEDRLVLVQWPAGQDPPYAPDAAIEALVSGWASQLDEELAEVIGYSETGIAVRSWQQGNWVCDAWLATFPEAQLAIQNFGGLREDVASGDIRKLDVFNVMPFDNDIYELELTGAQVRDNIALATEACALGDCPFVGGMRYQGDGDAVVLLEPNGDPLDLDASYVVLVNSFMYAGGDGLLFATQDETPIALGVNYRDPVIQWTESLGTTAADPLESHLDPVPRNE